MMKKAFERLTGFYPSASHYRTIEAFIEDFKGDADAFCKAYKANKDGLAERVQRVADETEQTLDNELSRLRRALAAEEEWKPYESPDRVTQAEYEALIQTGARELPDDEAADLIAKEFGFERSKISIVHEVYRQEINRHNCVRSVGMIPRKALNNSCGQNYIRFRVHNREYEISDGALRVCAD